jgi:hypothetical protein
VFVYVFVELTANRLQVVVVNMREALANVHPESKDVIACRVVLGCCWFIHRIVACGATNARSTGYWGRCEGDVCARIGRSVFLVESVAHSGRRRTQWEVAQVNLPVYSDRGCFGKHDLCSWLSPSASRGWWRLDVDLDILGVVHVVVDFVRVTTVIVRLQVKIVVPPGSVQRFEVVSARG